MNLESGIGNSAYYVFLCVLLLAASPFVLMVSVLLLILQGPPVFFCQTRAGKNGKRFTMYKFRTMIPGAQKLQKKLLHLNEAYGPAFKLYNDPRYTPIGKFLAHTGLDELPQLYNVLRGDMALLGPRPLPVSEERKLKVWQKARESVKPGIFSQWILEGYHRTTFDAWMRSDIRYTKNKSFWYDLRLSLRMIVFMGSLIGREVESLTGASGPPPASR